jgi:hypothetical protein
MTSSVSFQYGDMRSAVYTSFMRNSPADTLLSGCCTRGGNAGRGWGGKTSTTLSTRNPPRFLSYGEL